MKCCSGCKGHGQSKLHNLENIRNDQRKSTTVISKQKSSQTSSDYCRAQNFFNLQTESTPSCKQFPSGIIPPHNSSNPNKDTNRNIGRLNIWEAESASTERRRDSTRENLPTDLTIIQVNSSEDEGPKIERNRDLDQSQKEEMIFDLSCSESSYNLDFSKKIILLSNISSPEKENGDNVFKKEFDSLKGPANDLELYWANIGKRQCISEDISKLLDMKESIDGTSIARADRLAMTLIISNYFSQKKITQSDIRGLKPRSENFQHIGNDSSSHFRLGRNGLRRSKSSNDSLRVIFLDNKKILTWSVILENFPSNQDLSKSKFLKGNQMSPSFLKSLGEKQIYSLFQSELDDGPILLVKK